MLLVFVLNQLLVPLLLLWFGLPPGGARRFERWLSPRLQDVARFVGRRSGLLIAAAALLFASAPFVLTRLQVDQRFNEELAATHPVRVAQATIEEDFGGFLGPELHVSRRDGGSLLGDDSRARLARFRDAIAQASGRAARPAASWTTCPKPARAGASSPGAPIRRCRCSCES